MKKPKPKPKPDWPNLFTIENESGLNVADFCSVHNISTSSFYLNKQRSATKSNFVEAKVVHRVSEQISQITNPAQVITLTTQAGELSFPDTVNWRAKLF
ncbi:MAG: hypothetical protein ACI84K_000063 [Pseudohongiellaceae bacterium]|jgi:hypothetical protein